MPAPFDDPQGPNPQDIHAALDRICASGTFGTSPKLTSFLRFVVEATLSGHGGRLKGYTVGVEALGRSANFNPQIDPIVRVEAIRLRAALARYYSGDGVRDPVVIEMPRGHYVTLFRWRQRGGTQEVSFGPSTWFCASSAPESSSRRRPICADPVLAAGGRGCYHRADRHSSGAMAEKSDKSNKLKARLPRGLGDRGPAEIAATRRMIEAIRTVYERYGFDPVETPEIEYTDALGKFLPDQDRPNEGVFSFQDDDAQWLSLRYDLTAPLARHVAENFQHLAMPYRSYRFGWVFRNEKPGPGRFRQFMQFDADTVGSASMAADAEICMMAADTMEALGISRGQYLVKFSNRKILDGLLEAIGFDDVVDASRRLAVLRAIDKLDRLGIEGVRALLTDGREDESGDFTKGAGLGDAGAAIVIEFLTTPSGHNPSAALVPRDNPELAKMSGGILMQVPPTLVHNQRDLHNAKFVEGMKEADEIRLSVENAGFAADRICFDPSVVRGLEYYTGPVYEVELLLDTKDEKGRPVRFGSVGGGGRYDGLVSRFRGEPVPATGFSIGVSRLQAALAFIGKLDSKPAPGPVLVTVFDRDRVADYQRMVAALRNAGIRAELYLGSPKHSVGQQLKYADKRNSPCAVIQGGDEKAKGEIQIKDLIAGASLTAIKDRDEYLKQQAAAQFAVPEDKLVEAVRQVLTRHNVSWA